MTVHTADEEDAIAVVEAGANGLEHGVTRERLSGSKLGTLMRDRGAVYVATLMVVQRFGLQVLPIAMANLKQLTDEGVRIAMGSDTFGPSLPGESSIVEAELMVQAGLTPAQVIQAATSVAATHLGLEISALSHQARLQTSYSSMPIL